MITGLVSKIDGLGVVKLTITRQLDPDTAPSIMVNAVLVRSHEDSGVVQPVARVDMPFQPYDVAEIRPHVDNLIDAVEAYLSSKAGLFTGGTLDTVDASSPRGIIDFGSEDSGS